MVLASIASIHFTSVCPLYFSVPTQQETREQKQLRQFDKNARRLVTRTGYMHSDLTVVNQILAGTGLVSILLFFFPQLCLWWMYVCMYVICFYSCLLSFYMLINVDYTATYFLPIPSTVPCTRARSELLNISIVSPRVEFSYGGWANVATYRVKTRWRQCIWVICIGRFRMGLNDGDYLKGWQWILEFVYEAFFIEKEGRENMRND